MKTETCGICDVSICNHVWKLVEAGYLCGQDRNSTRRGNIFNVSSLSIYLSMYICIYVSIYLSIFLSIYLSKTLYRELGMVRPQQEFFNETYLSIYLSIYRSV